jgi:hypothetical protein
MNNSNPTTSKRLLSVYGGRECIGFVLPRAKVGFEAFDRDERSRGLFVTQQDAITALSHFGNHAEAGVAP